MPEEAGESRGRWGRVGSAKLYPSTTHRSCTVHGVHLFAFIKLQVPQVRLAMSASTSVSMTLALAGLDGSCSVAWVLPEGPARGTHVQAPRLGAIVG